MVLDNQAQEIVFNIALVNFVENQDCEFFQKFRGGNQAMKQPSNCDIEDLSMAKLDLEIYQLQIWKRDKIETLVLEDPFPSLEILNPTVWPTSSLWFFFFFLK